MRGTVVALVVGWSFGVAMASSHHPQQFLQEIAGKPGEGEKIVEHFCAVCHSKEPQIQLGAPRQGVDADWQGRIGIGLKGLLDHSAEGLNAMPARGGCFECSDDQLSKAILALLSENMRKKLLEK